MIDDDTKPAEGESGDGKPKELDPLEENRKRNPKETDRQRAVAGVESDKVTGDPGGDIRP